MADSIQCEACNALLDASETVCPHCGQTAMASFGIGPAAMLVDWIDGQGRTWKIEADSDGLILSHAQERFEFARSDWVSSIFASAMGRSVVIHFDTGDREIGFLVSEADGSQLFAAMNWDGGHVVLVEPPPPAVCEPIRAAHQPSLSPMWPRMTALPVVAVFLSAMAFVPVYGVPAALGAIVLAVIALRKTCPNASYLHIRVMAKLSIAVAVAGLAIGGLGAYCMSIRQVPLPVETVSEGSLEWSWGATIAALVMLLIALSVHEAAHAITAWWCGDDFARSQGRVTLNPIAHIDPFGTILLPLILAYSGWPVFGYARPVPVRLGSMRRFRRAHILISLAGPASNLLQAAACLALLLLMGSLLTFVPGVTVKHFSEILPAVEVSGIAGGRVIGAVALMLKLGFFVNIVLAFFNLIPIPPLDGSWVLEHLFPNTLGRLYAAIRPYGFLVFLAVIWSGTRALTYLMIPAVFALFFGQELIYRVTGF